MSMFKDPYFKWAALILAFLVLLSDPSCSISINSTPAEQTDGEA